MSRYRVDAIFINRWDGSGMCYCEHCRKNFRAASGLELPRTSDPQHPARRAYILWHQQRLFDLWRLWDAEVRKVNPDSCVIPNTGGGATSSLDMKKIGELASTLMADRQARRGLTAPWRTGRTARNTAPRWAETNRRHLQHRCRGTVSLEGQRAERGGISSLGGGWGRQRPTSVVHKSPACCTMSGGSTGGRNLPPLRPLGEIPCGTSARWRALAWSIRSKPRVPRPESGRPQPRLVSALIEARIPFAMVHDRLFDEAHLGPFKTTHPADIAALSEPQCQQLRNS